mgnify:FL=1|jgi:hypothetical protein
MLDPGQKKKGGYKTGLSGANLDGYIRGLVLEKNHQRRNARGAWKKFKGSNAT